MSSSCIINKEVLRLVTKPSVAIAAALNDAPTIFELGGDNSRCTVDAKTTALLLVQSKFFENMFKWGFKETVLLEGNQRLVRLEDMTLPLFHILLGFARTLKLPSHNMEQESFWALHAYAAYLDWDLLAFACEEAISKHLEPSTVCVVWNHAEKHDASGLSDMCLKYFTSNFASVATTPNFFTMRKDLLARALSTGDIDCEDDIIVRALFVWARFQHHSNPESRNLAYDPLRYVGDLLPPCTLFNTRTKASLLGYGAPQSRFF